MPQNRTQKPQNDPKNNSKNNRKALRISPNLRFADYDLSGEFFSLEGKNSPFSIKNAEIKALSDPNRPLGLSGHLRAKNEPSTIAAAIETALPALDELVITVQPFINESGRDETYEICKAAAARHGEKIRLFYYTPATFTFGGSHTKAALAGDAAEIDAKGIDANKTDDRSVHSFAHYTNFGLVKTRYKYYCKIDADQLYFTAKLRALRDAVLAADRFSASRRGFWRKVAGKLTEPFYDIFYRILPLSRYIALLNIINGRVALGLSGLELTLRERERRILAA